MSFWKFLDKLLTPKCAKAVKSKHNKQVVAIELRLRLTTELDRIYKTQYRAVKPFGMYVDVSTCLNRTFQTLTTICHDLKVSNRVSIGAAYNNRIVVTDSTNATMHTLLCVIERVMSQIASVQNVDYDTMRVTGHLEFTQLAWEMRELEITPIMIHNLLKVYFKV